APPAPAARPEGAAGRRVGEIGIVRPPGQRQAAPPEPAGRASADEARARGRGDLAGGSRGVITPPPPRPRGLSVSSRPSVGGPPAANPSQPPAQAATAERPAPAPERPAPGGEPPAGEPGAAPSSERKDDDASIRFSLLELD